MEVRFRPHRRPLPFAGCINTPTEAARVAAAIIADSTVEQVISLHLDTQRRLIGVQTVSVGVLDAALVHPREVFKAALLANAASLILAHNHPGGNPAPSAEDVAMVGQLAQAGRIVGIELDDALIVVDPLEGPQYFSFRQQGRL